MHVQPPVCARALVGMTRSGPHDFQSIFLRVRMLRLPLFDRFVVWIFCRGAIAVLAEKKIAERVIGCPLVVFLHATKFDLYQ